MYRPVGTHVKTSLSPTPGWGDLLATAILALSIYSIVVTAKQWTASFQPNLPIDLALSALPLYTLFSLTRAIIAYLLSLLFSLTVGYWAAKSPRAAKLLLPILDIGQSIPVLGFLPGLVLGLVALFPNQSFGLELACILMIFTGQVWNLAFGYYAALKAIPDSFLELGAIAHLTPWQRWQRIELPFAATSLAWNSMMSMAGGWFFLTVCESFTIEGNAFRVPGLGSYMALALEKGDKTAILGGLCAMISIIMGLDFLVWRPILAWTRKFRLDEQSIEGVASIPFVELVLQDSRLLRFWNRRRKLQARRHRNQLPSLFPFSLPPWIHTVAHIGRLPAFVWLLKLCLVGVCIYTIRPLVLYVWEVPQTTWELVLSASGITLSRVLCALLLASLWTVPFGIWVGLSPRRTALLQPLIQVMASFPAPMLYPLVLFALHHLHIGLSFGSVILMLLGVQWYVLFNVLAGATTISGELRDACNLMHVSTTKTWKVLYLPSILPSLITGWITAAGGAWNASIIAEYVLYDGKISKVLGIGSVISEATATGDFHLLAVSLIMMVCMVLFFNKWVWRRLYAYTERRFKIER